MCLPSEVAGATIQRIATIVGVLTCLNFGLMFGITPAHTQLYRSQETPLNRPINAHAATWVAGHLFLSTAVGVLTGGYLSQRIGPKSVLLLSGLLQITGWFCIHFAYDILHIYASRIFTGVAAGAAFAVLPIFISEVSQNGNAATLAVYIDQARALGILIGCALGWYLAYRHVAIVGVCLSFLFTMIFPFIQESPYYYLRKGDVPSLEKALRWFRGIRQLDDREKPEYLRELQDFKAQIQNASMAVCNMSRAYLVKVFFYCLLLAVGAQLSGACVILTYAGDIFDRTVAVYPLPVNVLILTAWQFVGAHFAVWIGQRINRKILLCLTSLISGLSLISLALFVSFGNQWRLNPLYTPWLPLALLSLHMFSANIGLYPLSTIVIHEILPEKLYAHISSFTVGISWLLLYLCIQYFHSVTALVGLSVWLWFFACVCISVALFSLLLLPETRGRCSEEVQQHLGYVPNGNVAKIAIITNGHITHDYI